MKTAEHIIETVDKLVRKYHTRDPYELCQLLGIKIHYYDLQKKLKGFFYYQSRQKNIVIDHNVNGILERILVAHELGHAVLLLSGKLNDVPSGRLFRADLGSLQIG